MLFDPGEITYISNKKLSKNLNKIFKDLDKKNILDFGAGANKFYKFIKYKKYFLYDLEPKFSKHHKSTCNLIIERDYKNIDIKLDIVLINSVIQYINIKIQ